MRQQKTLLLGAAAGGAVVFVLMATLLLLSGFQDGAIKIGVVDFAKLTDASNFGQQIRSNWAAMRKVREDLMEFVGTYPVITAEQAQKLRELSLKANVSAAEKAELERIKADVIATDKKNKELSTKGNLTPEERTLMDEYARRSQSMDQTGNRWAREFVNEMQVWRDQQQVLLVQRSRAAAQDAGRTAGYTLVLEMGVAPYGANDITDAALKAMNAKP
jgi:Skp family chaperone for outer membrane proteins